jgi:hypothetical protein
MALWPNRDSVGGTSTESRHESDSVYRRTFAVGLLAKLPSQG